MNHLYMMKTRQAKEFMEVSQEIRKYLKAGTCEPLAVRRRFKDALKSLRSLLDNNSIKMPSPVYAYNKDDEKTWKYLDVRIVDEEYYGAIENPLWTRRERAA